MLIAEMAATSKLAGRTLADEMDALYAQYGCFAAGQTNVVFTSDEQKAACMALLDALRAAPPKTLADWPVTSVTDFRAGLETDTATGTQTPTGLPRENMLRLTLGEHGTVILRPSGTEPKIKFYYATRADSMEKAQGMIESLEEAMTAMLK